MPGGGEVLIMNRNVSIVVVLLVLVVIVGYLIWIRSKVASDVVSPKAVEEVAVTPTAVPTATVSATPGAKEATGSMKQKVSTPSGKL